MLHRRLNEKSQRDRQPSERGTVQLTTSRVCRSTTAEEAAVSIPGEDSTDAEPCWNGHDEEEKERGARVGGCKEGDGAVDGS